VGRIAAQVASAPDAAHAHQLVHRDVKPGNILVAEGTDADHPEHVYLTDFGLTKKSLSLSGFTTVGQFVGTLDCVAPEQIAGKAVDGRCDVYSLGCVVCEMLTGAPPFRRDDDLSLLWAHQHDDPLPPTALRPDLPPGTDPVMARALAKSPDDRFDSCLDFVAALRRAWSAPEAPAATAVVRTPTQVAVHAPRESRSGVEDRLPLGPHDRPVEKLRPPPHWARPVYAPEPRRRADRCAIRGLR
jgi:serine/threonine-protein kinase